MGEADNGKPLHPEPSPERRFRLREDELVFHLVKDPQQPPDTLLLTGLLGRSSQPGHTRVYLDLLLSAYVDVPEDSVLYAEEIHRTQSPLGGHYIWIRRDADMVQRVREAYQRTTQAQQEFVNSLQAGIETGLPSATAAWPSLTNQF